MVCYTRVYLFPFPFLFLLLGLYFSLFRSVSLHLNSFFFLSRLSFVFISHFSFSFHHLLFTFHLLSCRSLYSLYFRYLSLFFHFPSINDHFPSTFFLSLIYPLLRSDLSLSIIYSYHFPNTFFPSLFFSYYLLFFFLPSLNSPFPYTFFSSLLFPPCYSFSSTSLFLCPSIISLFPTLSCFLYIITPLLLP